MYECNFSDIVHIEEKAMNIFDRSLQFLQTIDLDLDDYQFLREIHRILIKVNNYTGLYSIYEDLHPDAKVRKKARLIHKQSTKFMLDFGQIDIIYRRLVDIDIGQLDAQAGRYCRQLIGTFHKSGIHLTLDKRNRLKELEYEIQDLIVRFEVNANKTKYLRVQKKDLSEIPSSLLDSIEHKGDYVYIPVAGYECNEILTHADSRKLRKRIYTAYQKIGMPKNREVLISLVRCRAEYAEILDYNSFSEYDLQGCMLDTPMQVEKMLNNIARIVIPKSEAIKHLVREYKYKITKNLEIEAWDVDYWLRKYQISQSCIYKSALKPYLATNKVIDGTIELIQDLYEVRFHRIEPDNLWHESVLVYEVWSLNRLLLGTVYLDLFDRDDKYDGSVVYTKMEGAKGIQFPEVVLSVTLCGSLEDKESFMDYDEVIDLFHEFGHLMHGIMGGLQTWTTHSGINTERDFSEVPSKLFEQYARNYDVLIRFAKHYEKGTVLPRYLFDKVNESDKMWKILEMQETLAKSLYSLRLYSTPITELDLDELAKEVHKETSSHTFAEGTNPEASFSHLLDYNSAYYSYIWSLVIVADIIGQYQGNLMDKRIMSAYKEHILSRGGSDSAIEYIQNLLGRDVNIQFFADTFTDL